MLAASAVAVQAATTNKGKAMTIAPVDGGSDYYGRFSHGLPTDKSYFPIGAWLRPVGSQADINAYLDFGLNLLVGVEAPEFTDEALIRRAGIRTLIQADERTRFNGLGSETAGWMMGDEVDMEHGPGSGYTQNQNTIAGLPQDNRLRYSNYGQGVLFWETDAEAARFVNNFQQVTSSDLYWFTIPWSSMTAPPWFPEAGQTIPRSKIMRAANYGYQIDRMRALDATDGKRQPIWAFVELGWPWTESAAQGGRRILPAEIRAADWQSIIAGARGIIYFDHNFGPGTPDSTILGQGYADNRAMAKSVNAQIKSLAPVLNSPTVTSGWSQGPGTTAMVKWAESGKNAKKKCKSKNGKKHHKSCKKKNAKKAAKPKRCKSKNGKKCKKKKAQTSLYVFAGSAGSSVEGRFSLPCVGNAQAAVLGENRAVQVRDGSFSDHFADGNAIHIYRIDGRSGCASAHQRTATPIGLPSGGGGGAEPPASRHTTFLAHTTFWAITAALAVLLVGVGIIAPLTRRVGHRSGKRGKRSHRLGTR